MTERMQRLADDVTRDGKSLGSHQSLTTKTITLKPGQRLEDALKEMNDGDSVTLDGPLTVRKSDNSARERFIYAIAFAAGFTFALLLVVIWTALR